MQSDKHPFLVATRTTSFLILHCHLPGESSVLHRIMHDAQEFGHNAMYGLYKIELAPWCINSSWFPIGFTPHRKITTEKYRPKFIGLWLPGSQRYQILCLQKLPQLLGVTGWAFIPDGPVVSLWWSNLASGTIRNSDKNQLWNSIKLVMYRFQKLSDGTCSGFANTKTWFRAG